MNFLILGDGDEERAWAEAIAGGGEHRLRAAFPGFDGLAELPDPGDFEEALATSEIDAVIVGGPLDVRGEWLRRVAAAGLAAICLHPPGDDSEAYYQVALSRDETGAVLVPDLADRLHPGAVAIREALDAGDLGGFRGLRYERTVDPSGGDLARHEFARAVDVVRATLGEIEAVTATGDPPGIAPDLELIAQLRGSEARRGEVRLRAGNQVREPSRLILTGEAGSITWEHEPGGAFASRLIRRDAKGGKTVEDLPPFDAHGALLDALDDAVAGRDGHPDLEDGTKAMELAEATVRSLRRGRTVDLHYEQISEANSFKSVMTSTGCVLLLAILFALPVALAGPALGMRWTLVIAYAIPPLLVLFMLLQSLRFAVRDRRPP